MEDDIENIKETETQEGSVIRKVVPNNFTDDQVLNALNTDIKNIEDKMANKSKEIEDKNNQLNNLKNELNILKENHRRKLKTKDVYSGVTETHKSNKKEQPDKWKEYKEKEKEKNKKSKKKDKVILNFDKKRREPIFEDLEYESNNRPNKELDSSDQTETNEEIENEGEENN
jgi:hypothetical protein